MPKIDDAQRARRRQTLLDAARMAVARDGWRNLTVDQVCSVAGASKGMFYTYFARKEDLLEALLDEESAALDAVLADLDHSAGSPVARLRGFVRAILERGQDPQHVQVQADLWSELRNDPALAQRFAVQAASRRHHVASWITQAVERGELEEVPANALAAIVLALSDGLMIYFAIDPAAFKWANVRRAVDAVLDGLAP